MKNLKIKDNILLDFFEVKEIVEIWTNEEDWDIVDHEDNNHFHNMINKFDEKGFENLDTDLVQEVLIEKFRDKYHQYGEDEVVQEAYTLTQAIENIVYSEVEEEDYDE